MFIVTFNINANGQQISPSNVITAADQPELYLNKLNNKRVALMVNHTSMVNNKHLLDFLIENNINVKKIFAVEHGFRGNAPDGETINNEIDAKTKLPIVSLYGEKKKPLPTDLKGIDIVVFDIQDVGCRFFTYISSLHFLMEACAENNIKLLILDRPNPNGDYIDGPVLDLSLKSFVGMHKIPIVHGCTVGELALMINGEHWLNNYKQCDLEVITVKNYTHSTVYEPPIKPSPNLPNYSAIRLYPSLCFFEATNISIGRGTIFPFQVIGFPQNKKGSFSFTPRSISTMSTKPLHENIECNGIDLRLLNELPMFTLKFLIEYFDLYENKKDFWKSERWINLLSGDPNFINQINNKWTEEQIKATWQTDLMEYKKTRKKYLLYTDFE